MDSLTCWSIFILLALALYLKRNTEPVLHRIPSVGPTSRLVSYIGAIRFILNAPKVVQEGYATCKSAAFRVADLGRWQVVVRGAEFIDELRKAPNDVLSFQEATDDILQIQYTLGERISTNPYHIPIVRSQLTRNLGVLFPEIQDEVVTAFEDVIPSYNNDWSRIRALDAIMQIVCRTSNRLFVGLPVCRNVGFRTLNIQFTVDVVKSAAIISLLPAILRPLAAHFFTNVEARIRKGMEYLQPIVEERRQKIARFGQNYPDKPNDMLSWLMDEAKGDETSLRNLTLRILTVNFAAIHTTSMAFTHALYHLASTPELTIPLRDEVEAIVQEEGWTKASLDKMLKIDSFLKESQRLNGLGCLLMHRKALKPFQFSDGTVIPAGTFVSVASTSTHLDDANYKNATTFDAFRFAKNCDEDSGAHTKQQMVTTNVSYLAFGHGRHACPGRFFAANELKMMLAHVVLTYEVKLAEGVRPPNMWFAATCVPNPNGEVMFRRRYTST